VYDRQVTELDNIDDKAMRTTRTGILVLGFVAAALAASGPGAAGSLHPLPLGFAGLGVFGVFVSSFIGTGIYTLSEYPYEIDPQDLHAAGRIDEKRWHDAAIETVDSASAEIEQEIQQNARLLEHAQSVLLTGITLLVTSAGLTILRRSFGIAPAAPTILLTLIFGIVLVVVRYKTRGALL